jgi:hypothetical protein
MESSEAGNKNSPNNYWRDYIKREKLNFTRYFIISDICILEEGFGKFSVVSYALYFL